MPEPCHLWLADTLLAGAVALNLYGGWRLWWEARQLARVRRLWWENLRREGCSDAP